MPSDPLRHQSGWVCPRCDSDYVDHAVDVPEPFCRRCSTALVDSDSEAARRSHPLYRDGLADPADYWNEPTWVGDVLVVRCQRERCKQSPGAHYPDGSGLCPGCHGSTFIVLATKPVPEEATSVAP